MKRITPSDVERLRDNEIFVYGSDIAGSHKSSAASRAYKRFGATPGRCHGFDNQSYGIPTKDADMTALPLERIKRYVHNMIVDAQTYPEKIFLVTKIGCGSDGYVPEQIAPLFSEAIQVENVYLPDEFWKVLMNCQ